MITITKRKTKKKSFSKKENFGAYESHLPPRVYESKIEEPVFLREEYRPGLGFVAVFFNTFIGEEKIIVIKPSLNYEICNDFIDKIFKEKCGKTYPTIDKQNLRKHVA